MYFVRACCKLTVLGLCKSELGNYKVRLVLGIIGQYGRRGADVIGLILYNFVATSQACVSEMISTNYQTLGNGYVEQKLNKNTRDISWNIKT